MKSCHLLAVSTLLLVTVGCNGDLGPTGVRSTNLKPVDVISDGAHGGNHDFFFLPPLVPLPVNNPDFELGKFDNSLVPVLTIEICELVVAGTGLPAADSPCRAVDATHPLTKKFNAGTVQLVNLPLKQSGWWTLLGLPPDGFYYVLWNTQASNLSLSKYYRIKVFVNGSSDPIGYADVDPMGSLREWKYSLTSQVIQMVDDVLLPIPFRIEKGAFCATGAILCKSVVVPKDNPNGTSTIVQLQGATGSIAGAEFPDNWLPPGVDNVVVTISRLPGGPPNADGSRSIRCHPDLRLLQFDGCFQFSTNPVLPIVDGKAFAKDVRIAVCYVLHDTDNQLRDWAEIYSSGPREQTHALRGAPDATILTNHDCVNADPPPIVTMSESNPVTRLAAAGWRKLKDVFTVPTAHAVDLGLGGLTSAFSNEGPAITAELRPVTSTQITAAPGEQVFVQARTVGTKYHDGTALGEVTLTGNTHGFPGLPVTFSLVPPTGGGSPGTITSGLVTGTAPITVTSNGYLEGSLSGGFASVVWQMPDRPGTYSLTVDGPAFGGPLTFTATVVAPAVSIDGVIGTAEWADATTYGPYTINLPGGAQTTATIYLKNTGEQLFGAVKFGQDLSSYDDVILALMMDINGNNVWDNNEDGFVVHQHIAGGSRNVFFDEYALCAGSVCNEAIDTQHDGTNDGSTASTDGGPPTSVEFVKLTNSGDALDAHLVAGQTLRFFFFTNIGTGPTGRSETWYPSHFTTASYTVR